MDTVTGVFSEGGFVEVIGAAVDLGKGAPVKKVELLLDGSPRGIVSLGGYRPDVLVHFARPDYLWSGWRGTATLEEIWPGTHTVSAVGYTQSGEPIPCGTREFQVQGPVEGPARPPWRIGLGHLAATALVVLWLTLIGLPIAHFTGRSPLLLRAPFLGLALFAVGVEALRPLGARPFGVAAGLGVGAIAWTAGLLLSRRMRLRRPAAGTLATLACMAIFAVVGVIPVAVHGEGAVLGTIDDAVRECAVADSINLWGWNDRPDVPGYLGIMPGEVRKVHMREGGAYVLAATARALRTRAHAVYEAVMIAMGCLVVAGAGLLAHRVLRRHPGKRWLAPALVAINSTLIATLYGQHLGSLFFAALSIAFVFHLLALIGSWSPAPIVPVAMCGAGAFSLYPEGLATWVVAAVLAVLLPMRTPRRWRTLGRLVAAGALALVLNPVGVIRSARNAATLSSGSLGSSYQRLLTGDTHYFPSLHVVTGVRAYREDAPAPVGLMRSVAIPLVTVLVLIAVVAGWSALRLRQRRLLLFLWAPVALALIVNYWIGFPYGYAKYLPVAVPLWAVGFVLLAVELEHGRRAPATGWRVVVGRAALAGVALLALPASRHVVRRAMVEVPSYDEGFRVLPRLAAAVRPDSVIRLEGPPHARRSWIEYFLGETEVDFPNQVSPVPDDRRLLLVDRRTDGGAPPARAIVSSRGFLLVPFRPPTDPAS